MMISSHKCQHIQNKLLTVKKCLKAIAFYFISVIIINSVTGL